MPKPFLPPQGGEKWLCLGMFLTLMMSVIMIVVVIYCIVIIYDPSVKEIYSEINPEPKRCSTTFIERNITGTPEDQKCNWSSCEEWCLSKGASPCSKVRPMFISDLNITDFTPLTSLTSLTAVKSNPACTSLLPRCTG